jgi:hypothetical protein
MTQLSEGWRPIERRYYTWDTHAMTKKENDALDALREAMLNLETLEDELLRTKRRLAEWVRRLEPKQAT